MTNVMRYRMLQPIATWVLNEPSQLVQLITAFKIIFDLDFREKNPKH